MGKPSIGLALGGGGARGIAHIGVLQTLTDGGIVPDLIAGTSAGAIVGAMFASNPDANWVEQRFREFLDSRAFSDLGTDRLARRHNQVDGMSPFGRRLQDHVVVNLSLMRQFAIPREKLNSAMEFLVPARRFEDLELPLVICATEIQTGQAVIYDSGDLISALSNSAAIPGVLESERHDDRIIADGGVVLPMPVEPLASRVDFIVASEISKRSFPPMEHINIHSMIMRAEQITQRSLAQQQASRANFVLTPDVMDLHWSQFEHFDQLLSNGRQEVETELPALIQRLNQFSSIQGRLRRWLRSLLNE